MDRFRTGMRVRVTEHGHPLEGRKGTVKALNVIGPGAAVLMDGGLPKGHDLIMDGRQFDGVTALQPHQCEEVR